MNSRKLPFRQIHLDFHTSPHVPGIGEKFNKAQWQETLKTAKVNLMTLFAKCHHGWSYHPTRVGKMHPELAFDLLRAQYEACQEIGIATPIYLSAGFDDVAGDLHPEWLEVDEKGNAYFSGSPLKPGFKKLDFLSPYTDYLCAQIAEVLELFPECDGIFLDIVAQRPGCSKWRMQYMESHGLDAENEEDRRLAARAAHEFYLQRTTAAVKEINAAMPVFHNAGHLQRGRRDILAYYDHLELESLPTGGWGYDHFPLSARYAGHLGREFIGMTGKFHTAWGEFGGLKHPNALRYECAQMIAFNAKCSIGDQLHPNGLLDASTYRIIGEAYSEVAEKEPWCEGVRIVSDIGVLSSEAENQTEMISPPDEGASRALLEGHFLFEVIDREVDFTRFKLLILPDDIRIDDALKQQIDHYIAQGGKVLFTGESGLWKDKGGFAFEIGAEHFGTSPFSPDYALPAEEYRAGFVSTPVVMYQPSQRIKATTGQSLGEIYDPYFNRTYRHFCSHQHTPYRDEPSGYDSGVRRGNMVWLAHPVFTLYRKYGAVVYREMITRVIHSLIEGETSVATNLPSAARITLNHQPEQNRYVLHLLYANTLRRGGDQLVPGCGVEVIEELNPLVDTKIILRNLPEISSATLEPQGTPLPFQQSGGSVELHVEKFSCHQMIAIYPR